MKSDWPPYSDPCLKEPKAWQRHRRTDAPSTARNPRQGARSGPNVAQIERTATIIGDRELVPALRTEALRFLIHFIGDLHQPLHAANNSDRGGNGVTVIIAGRRTNLHAVWDGDVVRALGLNSRSVAASLLIGIRTVDRRAWQEGIASTWANETFEIARREIYGAASRGASQEPLLLDRLYAQRQSEVAGVQLQKAGVRLATILNEVLR